MLPSASRLLFHFLRWMHSPVPSRCVSMLATQLAFLFFSFRFGSGLSPAPGSPPFSSDQSHVALAPPGFPMPWARLAPQMHGLSRTSQGSLKLPRLGLPLSQPPLNETTGREPPQTTFFFCSFLISSQPSPQAEEETIFCLSSPSLLDHPNISQPQKLAVSGQELACAP